jgi:hypothetical protein
MLDMMEDIPDVINEVATSEMRFLASAFIGQPRDNTARSASMVQAAPVVQEALAGCGVSDITGSHQGR